MSSARPIVFTERQWLKISGWGLEIEPIQFVVAGLSEGALVPGYGLISHWISGLVAPPNDQPHFAPGTTLWCVLSVSLIPMALLVFVGLRGLKHTLWERRSGKLILVLIGIIAVGSIGRGIQ